MRSGSPSISATRSGIARSAATRLSTSSDGLIIVQTRKSSNLSRHLSGLVLSLPVKFEIAPGFSSEDWCSLKTQLPRNGEWAGAEAQWDRAISAVQSRIQKRFLDLASHLRAKRHAGFAILALDCLLLETIEAFRNGKRACNPGESRAACIRLLTASPHFRQFFDAARAGGFFAAVRNGLLHDGETRDGWLVKSADRYGLIQDLDEGYVVVNRDKFHLAIEAEFHDYLAALSVPQNAELRMNLAKALDDLCERSRPKPATNMRG